MLGESPTEAGRPMLGVEVEPANPVSRRPRSTVEVDSGDVSGPSAGLAWTLAIIDRLTPGSLTDGRTDRGDRRDPRRRHRRPDRWRSPRRSRRSSGPASTLFIYPAATPADEQARDARIAGDDVDALAGGGHRRGDRPCSRPMVCRPPAEPRATAAGIPPPAPRRTRSIGP